MISMTTQARCQEVVAETEICFVELSRGKAYGVQNDEYISALHKVKSNSKFAVCVFKFIAMIKCKLTISSTL